MYAVIKSGGKQWCDRLRGHTNLAPSYSACTSNLIVNIFNDVAWRGKPDPFTASGLRKYQGVDSNDVSMRINQRTAAVSRVDRCVRLKIDHPVFGSKLAGN